MGITSSSSNKLPTTSFSHMQKPPGESVRKKVVVLGMQNAGKTSLVQKLRYGEPQNVKPTIGFNLETLRQDGLELMVFDIAGAARSMWSHYLENADIIIYVFDATLLTVYDTTAELLKTINKQAAARRCLFICALNKTDLDAAVSNQQFLDSSRIYDFVDCDMFLLRTSCVTGDGLATLMTKIASYYHHPSVL